MKNVAIIIPKLNGGGAERCVSNLSVELSRHYNLFIIVYDAKLITYPYSGELVNLNLAKSANIFRNCLVCVKRWYALKRIKKIKNIDVSISLMPGPNFLNVVSSCGDKVILSIRNCTSKESYGFVQKQMIKYACRNANVVVTLSEMVRQDLHVNFNIPLHKMVTIYNHVDSNRLSQYDDFDEIHLDPTKKYIVSIGRMCVQKGQWHLIRAFKKVLDSCPDLNLIIFGDGVLHQSFTDLVHDLRIEDRVLMPGYVKAPHRYLKYCEFFVFPSLFEGLGNAILEAMSFGLPVISSDCMYGPREILAPDTDYFIQTKVIEYCKYGIMVPVDYDTTISSDSALSEAEEMLATSIVELHTNNDMLDHYREASFECIKRFDSNRIINQWIDMIGS